MMASPSTSIATPSASSSVATKDSAEELSKQLQAMTTNPTSSSTSSPAPAMDSANGLNKPSSSPPLSAQLHQPRPSTPRSQTDPSSDVFTFHNPRPRNRSPYSRSHLRSHSSSSSLSAPPMTRAHSLPTVINPIGHLSLSPSPMPLARPSSPLRSPKRTRSPYRNAEDTYVHSGAPSVCDISEDAELELTPKAGSYLSQTPTLQSSPLSSIHSLSNSLPRQSRRRPASPLYQSSLPFGGTGSAVSTPTSTSSQSSPLLQPSKFNEPFPGTSPHYASSLASSSIPSTPTSVRSRSPSISSLETIPDTPDAEAEAIEADRIARLKAAAEKEKNGDDNADLLGRTSLDVPGDRRGLGFGKRDSRKRWSVCGAERRGDLDLETIWED